MSLHPEQIGDFYAENRSRLYAAAYRIAGSPHDAEDAVQEAMLAALATYAGTASPEVENLEGLIFSTTSNQARVLVKRRGKSDVAMDIDELDAAVSRELDDDPDLDRPGALQSALTELEDDQIAALLDHYEHGISVGEIATEMEVKVNTLRSRMMRSRQQLVPHLVESAMLTLAQAYGNTFAPRLAQRAETWPLELVHIAGDVVCLGTPQRHGLIFVRQPVEPPTIEDPATAMLVLDTHDVLAPRMTLVQGDRVEQVPLERGLVAHLDLDVSLFVTAHYFSTVPGQRRSVEELVELAGRLWAELQKERGSGITGHVDALSSEDPELQLTAASALLRLMQPREVIAALNDHPLGLGKLEARRRGLLGYARLLDGDLVGARADFHRATSLDAAEWEWHLHASQASSLLGESAEAATSLVRALIVDGKGSGRVEGAVRWIPSLRPILEVPRLWRLLERPERIGLLSPTHLPLVPGIALEI